MAKHQRRWKTNYNWLRITKRNTMICDVFVGRRKSFVSDGVHSRHNEFQRLSALKDHKSSECRDTGIKEMKHEEAVAAGESLPPKHIVHEVPTDSAIASGMQKMSEKERAGITKLMDIAYFIALKRRPFTDSNDHI